VASCERASERASAEKRPSETRSNLDCRRPTAARPLPRSPPRHLATSPLATSLASSPPGEERREKREERREKREGRREKREERRGKREEGREEKREERREKREERREKREERREKRENHASP